MADSRMNRRQFLTNTAFAGAGLLILKDSRSAFGYQANEKLNVAIIGPGGRGNWFVQTIPNLGENVVAMCDVNDRACAGAFKAIPKAKRYYDFRRMFDEMQDQIDAVTVSTPDNTHAVATAAAIRAGKGVLCEKPLTHDVAEARKLTQLAAQYKVPTQMGNQGTASQGYREAVDIIWSGALGEIREVHAWKDSGGQGHVDNLPTDAHPLPDYLKWNLWLGPAQWREFNSRWFKWHTWRDFATGNLGNWGCHTMNVLFRGLRLDTLWQKGQSGKNNFTMEAEVSGYHKETFPKWEFIRSEFPARGDMPPVTVNWYNGIHYGPFPRKKIEELVERKLQWKVNTPDPWHDHAGCVLVGSKGVIHSNAHNTLFKLHPEAKFKDFTLEKRTLPRSRGHEREFFDACKGADQAPLSNFNYAGPLAEFALLGNVATQFKGKLEYDPNQMKIVNNSQADTALKRDYRKNWSL